MNFTTLLLFVTIFASAILMVTSHFFNIRTFFGLHRM